MIVYESDLVNFINDENSKILAQMIKDILYNKYGKYTNNSEFNSWKKSL